MRIQNNIPAINTLRNMGINVRGTSRALETLSSGFRINRAGDDAAGLAISEKMRAQVRGLNRASMNAQDGVSLVQSAEGALQEAQNILQRMRELAVQAANDVNTTEDRQALQNEVDQLIQELDRISQTTEFNGRAILDGSLNNGLFIRTATGFNISNLGITPLFNDEGASVINPSLTSISVVQAGIRANVTFDFSLNTIADENEGLVSGYGVTTELVAGSVMNVTITGDIARSAGRGDGDEDVTLQIAINAGETGAIIASNAANALQQFLGNDWIVTTIGSRLNVQHRFVGYFGGEEMGITFELEEGGEMFVSGGEWELGEAEAGEDQPFAVGTWGRDVAIVVNVGEEEVELANTNLMFPEPDNEGPQSEVDGAIHLRGRDSAAVLRFVAEDPNMEDAFIGFQFSIQDATRLSGAIISIDRGRELTLQAGANSGWEQTIRVGIQAMNATRLGVAEITLLDHHSARMALDTVDRALQIVSDQRALLGATQNRLEHTILNIDNVAENLQESESRIRDADLAREMMIFTRNSILLQASQAMMAQSNNLPQGVLQLLR